MSVDKLIRLDGIKWFDTVDNVGQRNLTPICPQHNLRLSPVILYEKTYRAGFVQDTPQSFDKSKQLRCDEGEGHFLDLPRQYGREKNYIADKIAATSFAKMPVINLDDEVIPVAQEELKNTDYWVRAKVTESKSGTRLIVWAGSKSKKNKVQLFVEPELKRMSFDQNDDHPLEVFAKVEAIFADEVKTIIKHEK